ncbi:MAG: chromosome segregation protein SMC [Eubacteriales bacterium]|nr:chromosome segregation protein SMC [Eubacteriales bacterium]
MYLKSIEVQGFKSFANRMKFEFHNGITGIVGPNGSGKSNVADAVRWVLGEQSAKQLRGANMQDIIFAGTEHRKPLGFAMVSITLDNSDHRLPVDFTEVTVTRRLYRSGESEYLINGTGCRLRDIQEMFYDTGIGKEGYSIIGQGQIDKILSGRPEERRELFDEAAGIVKFKRRKQTTMKKLEDEESNLTRVRDILSELNRQIGPLERQAEKARLYLKKRDELKKLDINQLLLDRERTALQLKQAEEKLQISEEDLKNVGLQIENVRKSYDRIEAASEKLQAEIEEKQGQLSESRLLRSQRENQIELLSEQIRLAQANDEHYLTRLHTIEEDRKSHRQELELAAVSRKELAEKLGQAKQEESGFDKRSRELAEEISGLERETSSGQAELIDHLNHQAGIKAGKQRYDAMKEQLQIRNSELAGRILLARNEEEEFRKNLETLKEDHRAIQKNIEGLHKCFHSLTAQEQKLTAALSEQGGAYEKVRMDYHREASRLESLRNITERYDGYGNSIRRVMEQKAVYPGLHGVVADLMQTDRKYELAIETALGGSIQNIVTQDEETAKSMIDFLKKNKYGRATFLPLSAIRSRGGISNERALYEAGVIGIASTLVRTEDRYEQLVESLLGKTLVVGHIDHAIAISRKYRQTLRIVTLDGELFNAGGAISGGAFKNSSNLLGRRREIDDLKQKAGRLYQEMLTLQEKIEKERAQRQDVREELRTLQEELQSEMLRENTAKLRLAEIDSQKEKNRSGSQQLSTEAADIAEQLQSIERELENIRQKLQEGSQLQENLENRIRAGQSALEEKRKQLEAENGQLLKAGTEAAELKQKEEFVLQNIARLKQELTQLEQEQREIEEILRGQGDEIARKTQEMEQIRSLIAAEQADEQELEQELSDQNAERKQLTEKNRGFFEKQEELMKQSGLLEKEKVRLETQKERLSEYQERQVNYLWEEYELTLSEARELKDDTLASAEDLKKQVSQRKAEIKALGPVNVHAMEEYREVHERQTFLTDQYNDLVEAGDALKKIITELDTGMRRQFNEKFAQMQEEFSKSFRALFGGGSGKLSLVEDEDILEAGILINAQPPGKKLQNMMQMSGGEKALTAIALLFAIQNMQPSPFCLLDEIEAALDESNVARYAQYLHKLTKNTQFIIITHRRGTMEAADRLYGITMQEKGVSTQVSVNMVEGDLDQ